jgi:hypothetical protein
MAASHALALAQPPARRATPYGTRAQLASSVGDVEGYLALAACDKRAGTASYALRVVNQSAHALRARMSCARLRGEPVLAYPLDVQIAPFSISETLLPIRVADVGPFDRAIVHVAGGDVAFSLEAPAPPKSHARPRWAALLTAAVALTIATGLAAAAATPRIGMIAAPSRIFTGSNVDVPYAFGGWAAMHYALKTHDGRQLFAGLVPTHEGTLHFNVPVAAGRDVILDVNVAGPFGSQSSSQHMSIAAAPPAPARAVRKSPLALAAPRIGEFTVVTPVVHANADVTFAYATNARDGEIWIIDETGRLWARAPISPYGQTSMKLPQGTAGRQMRAVLHARIAKADAVASIGLTVLPGAVVSDTASVSMKNTKSSAATISLSTERASPGEMITVAIEGNHGDTQVSLNDSSGNSIEQGDIPAGQNAVTLSAPSVTSATTYYIMASVTQGIGEQTLVRKLLVSPR